MTPAQDSPDAAETIRRARFRELPKRIRLEEMVEERAATAPDPTRDAYDAHEWLIRYCL